MKLAPTFAALALAAGLATANASFATELATEPHVFPVTAKHRVHLEFPVGELRVIPSDEARVRFDLRVRCKGRSDDRCEELANRLVLESDDTGGTLHLKLEKHPKWHTKGLTVIGELHVPRALAVDVEMGVGELDIEGLDIDADAVAQLLAVDEEALKGELPQVEEHLARFGDTLPAAVREQFDALKARLGA